MKIREISTEAQMSESCNVIRQSFITVRRQFDFTAENCPTHPSFITYEKINELYHKGLQLFGLYLQQSQIGFAALERAESPVFYLEKLAVLPLYRNKGYGRKLVDHAVQKVIEQTKILNTFPSRCVSWRKK